MASINKISIQCKQCNKIEKHDNCSQHFEIIDGKKYNILTIHKLFKRCAECRAKNRINAQKYRINIMSTNNIDDDITTESKRTLEQCSNNK